MKLSLFPIAPLAALSVALAAAAACATSEENAPSPPIGDEGGTTLPEAAPPVDAATDTIVEAGNQICSDAGWCATNVPGPGTRIQDIWPLEQHAFALATSTTTTAAPASTKVLEWDEAMQHWGFIDDDSQNHLASFQFSNIWAPNDNEVYFTGSTFTTSYLFHGQRPVAPSTVWSWTQTGFDCAAPGVDFPQVWGTSATDIYFWGCQTIYHETAAVDAGADAGDSGIPGWTKEFSDPAAPISSVTITGTGPDDIWFVGTRTDTLTWLFLGGGCTTAVRKTASGYHVVVDAALDGNCGKVGNLPVVEGVLTTTGLVGASFATSKGELIGVRRGQPGMPGNPMVKVDTNDTDGGTTVTLGPPTPNYVLSDSWGAPGAPPFVLGQVAQSSFVLRGPDSWNDAGTYSISTLVRNERPNTAQLNRIRGSSSTNIWAVGDDNAYHKTTP